MNGREIIKAIMELKTINNATLASKLEITQAALWDRLDTQPRKNKPRKDIPVSLLSEMVSIMGYKVIVVPENTTVSDNSFVIGENTDEKLKLNQKEDVPKQVGEKPTYQTGKIKLSPVTPDYGKRSK